jgi:hypothetical protein
MAVMDSRSMQQVVHFLSAFSLPGFDTPQQSGTGAGPKAIMNPTTFMRRNPRPLRHEAATHLCAVGQASG